MAYTPRKLTDAQILAAVGRTPIQELGVINRLKELGTPLTSTPLRKRLALLVADGRVKRVRTTPFNQVFYSVVAGGEGPPRPPA